MARNLKGKTVTKANAYEVVTAPDPFGDGSDWTWYVLKHYASTETELADATARVFCLVEGYESEMGDVYITDIPGLRNKLRAQMVGDTSPRQQLLAAIESGDFDAAEDIIGDGDIFDIL